MSESHDDKVYSYNDKYYICLTVNCKNIETGTVQKDVEEDIMRALGDKAVPGSFGWESDTRLYLEITEIGGKYYITARSLQEKYSARQYALGNASINVPCDQVISGMYSYDEDDCTITEAEKMNLA